MKITEKKNINIWENIAKIAALFALLVSVLLIVNYFQYKTMDPVETKLIDSLVQRLNQDPNDTQLREEIRALDLLSRKAYFTKQWQVKTGGYLLLISIVVLLIAQQMKLGEKSKEVVISEKEQGFLLQKKTRFWVGGFGVIMVVLALSAAWLSNQELGNQFKDAIAQEQLPEESMNTQIVETNSVVENDVNQTPQEEEIIEEPAEEPLKEEVVLDEKGEPTENTPAQVISDEKELIKEKDKPKKNAQIFPSEKELKANFNAFRGYGSNGIDFHKNIPTTWNGESGESILWKTAIPIHGYNSPIIWDDKLFISGANADQREVYCLDRNTGDILWTYQVTGVPGSPAQSPKVTDDTGLAAPTLTTNGQLVFALFGNSDLVALDLDGNLIWSKNLGPTNNHYGHSSSLMIYEDILILQWDVKNNPRLIGLNAQSGEQIYETPRKVKISWASPVLVDAGNQMEVILVADPIVASYNPKTGEEYWQLDCIFGEVGPSVAFGSELIYAVNEYAVLVAIKPGDTPEIVWENDELLSDVPSPIVKDGLMYLATSYGVVVCYDAESGEKYWEQEFSNGFYGSPMYSDGNIFIMDMDGVVHVFKASKTYQAISSNPLGEGGMTTPAFMDGRVYIRGNEHLFCVGK